ncbi:MAG: hypothetical protein HYW25_05745 [Candidatus Aenigmarchaeota archaeon]|nr:hypothetical protein [Candidatus Aenigmarchaeota archaeon]
MHPGCGVQLAYKILQDCVLEKAEKDEQGQIVREAVHAQWLSSLSTASHFKESQGMILVSNPPAAGDFCFIDDATVLASLPELLAKDAFVICLNLSGRIQFARYLGLHGYAATASPAFYEDMTAKIKKAATMKGLRFIEVISPCPTLWKSEPSNTVEIARQAVSIGLWPLFEIDHGIVTVSHKPAKLEAKAAFETMQHKVRVDESNIEKTWKKFLVKPYEAAL